jgi:hypothetical protein
MKTTPWFSTETKTSEENVHHDNTSCLEGDIEKNHHRHGTDNRPLCKQCARLDAAGK